MQIYIREFYTNTANWALLHSGRWYYAVFLTMYIFIKLNITVYQKKANSNLTVQP